jgi:predicted membrane-bound mannosyltransferase
VAPTTRRAQDTSGVVVVRRIPVVCGILVFRGIYLVRCGCAAAFVVVRRIPVVCGILVIRGFYLFRCRLAATFVFVVAALVAVTGTVAVAVLVIVVVTVVTVVHGDARSIGGKQMQPPP